MDTKPCRNRQNKAILYSLEITDYKLNKSADYIKVEKQTRLLSFDQLVEDSEDRLFHKLCNNNGHTICTIFSHHLIPQENTTISALLHHTIDCYLHVGLQATLPMPILSHDYCTCIKTCY